MSSDISDVSVIIPTYNRASLVVQAVESVLAQTCRPTEIIVVDDGSMDDTEQCLRLYSSHIRYIKQANAGAAAARNNGIRQSSGRLVAFLDSDDIWYPHKLERQVPLFAAPEVGLVFSDAHVVSSNGAPLPNYLHRYGAQHECVFSALLRANFVHTSSVVVTRSCLNQVGLFDESLRWVEDLDLWLRICYRCGARIIDEPLCLWRHQDGGLTKHRLNVQEGLIRVSRRWVDSGLTLRDNRNVRTLLSLTHFEIAFSLRDSERLRAMINVLNSLKWDALNVSAWRCLASLFFPTALRKLLRNDAAPSERPNSSGDFPTN